MTPRQLGIKLHEDYYNKPRLKVNETFHYKGRNIRVLYCYNLLDRKSIAANGRSWMIRLESDERFPRKELIAYETYIVSLKTQPKKVTDHNWSNRNSVRFS